MEKKYHWHLIPYFEAGMIAEKEIHVAEVNHKKICIAKYNGGLFAFAYKCPHAGGVLADGNIDDSGNIICPVHRYKYKISNGHNSSGEGFYLTTYPLEIRDDGVYAGFAESGIWNIFR